MTVNQVHQAPSHNGIALQEQPLPKAAMEGKKYFETKTILDKIEKGVRAVDALNIFVPYVPPTRLVVKTGLYSSSVGNKAAFPIVECRSGKPFQDLEIKTMENDLLVVQDSSTGATVVVIERADESPNSTYQIFKTTAVHQGQEPDKKHQGVYLYALANVDWNSPRDLDVFTIEKAGILLNSSSKYSIKQRGVKKTVASTHPWEAKNYMLAVTPGMDVLLMMCLGIIADDIEMSRGDSFSDVMNKSKLNPKSLFRKLTSNNSDAD